MRTRNKIINALIGCVLISVTASFLQSVQAKDANVELFRDKNGYFAAIPPEGWKQEGYPAETIRSKIAFHNPREKGVNIRIISGPTPSPNYSLEDLYHENQEKINNFFRRKWPRGTYKITKDKIGDRDAAIQRNSLSGQIEQEIVLFVNEGIWYSITLNAKTKAQFNNNQGAFRKFLDNFVILETNKKFTDEEVREGLVAKYKRIAILHEKMGKHKEALEFLKEGLAIDPDNKELRAMEKTLRTKK